MSNTVVITWDKAAIAGIEKRAMQRMVKLGAAIGNQAKQNAPYLTGALRNTIHVADDGQSSVDVIAGGQYGGFTVPYAYVRELGPNRNPATVGYMSKSLTKVTTGDYIKKYFGGIA